MPRGTTGSKDKQAPVVTITSPFNLEAFLPNSPMTVAVTATDNKGVTMVDLKFNGVIIRDISSPYTATFTVPNASPGSTFPITAVAYDAAGNYSMHTITIQIIETTTTTTTVDGTTTTTTAAPMLPFSYFLKMPPVQNQGGEGSCAAFAVGYAARSVDYYYKNLTEGSLNYSGSVNYFSPEFLYNKFLVDSYPTFDCGNGIGVTTSLDILRSTGICLWNSMPYSSYNGCSTYPNSGQLTEAANYKITSYYRMLSTDITAIKSAVYSKRAVIISVGIDQNFTSADANFVWRTAGPLSADHAMVICGWDDSKNAYRIFNSYGTNWGDGGYSWIDYNLFPQIAFYYVYAIN